MTIMKNNRTVMVKKGDYVRIGPKHYKYVGKFDNIHDVPLSDCLYVISGHIYIRQFDLNRLNMTKNKKVKEQKDTSGKLDLSIKPDDNELLIILKELMAGYTKNEFKKLFDDDSECNNMRRSIESGNGQFSWIRFTTMMTKLGLKYQVRVFKKDEEEGNEDDKQEEI